MTTKLPALPKDIKPFTPKVTVPTTLAFEVPNDRDALDHIRKALVSYSNKIQTVPEFLFLLTRSVEEEIKWIDHTQNTLKQ